MVCSDLLAGRLRAESTRARRARDHGLSSLARCPQRSYAQRSHICLPSMLQAFVPKRIGATMPISNQTVATRAQQETHGRHLRNLYEMSPQVDTRWGGLRNGVREQKQPMYNHVRANLKRAQIQDERFAEIELENTVLLEKLSKILRRSRNPTVGTRDWTGGIRLTPNMVPVIDHWISAETTAFGAAMEPTSLNLSLRRNERLRIEVENRALVARLQTCKPTYDITKLDKDDHKRRAWLASHSLPRPMSPTGGAGRLATADTAIRSTPDGASTGRKVLAPIAKRTSTSAGTRPGSKKGGAMAKSSGVDAVVLQVLDLLSRHMRGASSSLAEMRLARDSLMEGVHPIPADVRVETVDAGGVATEVVTHPRAAALLRGGSSSGEAPIVPTLLVLVHGGMFVTGSPRAGRHLAAKLSELVGAPVATPTLRLAPEHPYPAALDDLSAAYAALGSMPLCGGVPPKQLALFAESSGGALALAMLSRQTSSRKLMEPAAIVLASPWLDLTCSGQSYVANEARDPVMQRKRLLGISRAYLGETGISASDPAVSPVHGSSPSLLGLPPTLVQVGLSEVLVDDSYELESLAKGAGADVRVQLWDGVLHAWHTFFPLMPRALEALCQAAEFLCDALKLPLPAKQEFQPSKAAAAASLDAGGRLGTDDGGIGASADTAEEEERAQAALKLQALTRGRAARKSVATKKVVIKPSAPTTVKWTVDYDAEHEAAAVRVQALTRGRKARNDVAFTYGSSGLAEDRAIKRRALEVKADAVGLVEAHGRGGALAQQKHEEALEAQRQLAATRIQAIKRGRDARAQRDFLTPNTEAFRKAEGKEKLSDFTATSDLELFKARAHASEGRRVMDEDEAAVKMQAIARGRVGRQAAKAEVAERKDAATKLAAARRGQLARRQVAEERAELDAAAAKLQKMQRGKLARKSPAQSAPAGEAE